MFLKVLISGVSLPTKCALCIVSYFMSQGRPNTKINIIHKLPQPEHKDSAFVWGAP